MLKHLWITNLAIIENVDFELSDGFSVLTGATGAGKSLVIDSLSLLLGARASSELIRTGEDKAILKGEFVISSSRLSALLSQYEIPVLEDRLIIERMISKTKSVIKANGVNITLAQLNAISVFLADIHNQFDYTKILNPENYLGIIDGFAYEFVSPYLKDYQEAYGNYLKLEKELRDLEEKKKKLEENQDFYAFQFKELDEAGLSESEEQELEDSISLMRNYDKIYSLSQEASELMRGEFLDRLYDLKVALAKLASFQTQYQEDAQLIDDRYAELDDTFRTLKRKLDNLDYDPAQLEVALQRQADLSSLKRKYKKSIPELIVFRDELKSLLNQQTSIDDDIKAKEAECKAAYEAMAKKAEELSTVRKQIAASIEKELLKNLSDLLLNAYFKIEFTSQNPHQFTINGKDEVDFLIETNIGEGLKPLAKIISGGEASRIMLALKAIFVKANKVSTVIFDEIDTGISGEASAAVAMKIKEISYARQVIAITHLPQVASASDHHILVEKNVFLGRTYVSIKELSLEEKIREVAALISGGKVTEKQLAYAKEMVLGKA